MSSRPLLTRSLVAVWCLAAGCAKVSEQIPRVAATADEAVAITEEAVTVPQQAGSPTAAVSATAEPAAPEGTSAALPDREASIDEASAPAEGPLAPPPVVDVAPAAPEPPVIADSLVREDAAEAELGTPPAVAPGDTLDVAALLVRLRKTKAINLRTKLAVKNESDDLMEQFRAYHAQSGSTTLAELRRSYDLLFVKLQALLEEGDPPLARDIDRSRAAIWAILADPLKFAAPAPSASTRSVPHA
jgi:hypothetical protein